MFLVLEGLDGCGTTTQCARVAEALRSQGRTVTSTHEPTDGPIGRMIRSTLRGEPGAPHADTLPWLFAADRADHLRTEVEPALALDRIVVSDRYYPSSLAYQSLHLPLERVHALNRGFRVPDLTVYLDIDVETALRRVEARGGALELYETRERLSRVREAYEVVFARLGQEGERIATVDGAKSVEAVTEDILALL